MHKVLYPNIIINNNCVTSKVVTIDIQQQSGSAQILTLTSQTQTTYAIGVPTW